jgi:hypothetical protein
MPHVSIIEKQYDNGWRVLVEIETDDGKRVGPHSVGLPETATDAEIEAAILAEYTE